MIEDIVGWVLFFCLIVLPIPLAFGIKRFIKWREEAQVERDRIWWEKVQERAAIDRAEEKQRQIFAANMSRPTKRKLAPQDLSVPASTWSNDPLTIGIMAGMIMNSLNTDSSSSYDSSSDSGDGGGSD